MGNPPPGQHRPDRRALVEAYQQAVNRTTGQPSPPPPSPVERARLSRVVVALLLAALLAWLIVAPPAWMRGPRPSPERAEASGRLALYLQARRIERFRSDSGRLPTDLSRVGAVLPDIQYRRTGPGSYQLVLPQPHIVYYSAASPESFLGDAMEVLNQQKGSKEDGVRSKE